MQYERGKLPLEEVLRMAGAEADAGMSELECEDIYHFLNILEETKIEDIFDTKIIEDIENMFDDFKKLAIKQWNEIESF